MRIPARFILVLLPLVIALAGCPTIKLGDVAVKGGSVSSTGFTLTADLLVEEKDATEGEDSTPQTGRGMLALNLPVGWTVAAARVKSPQESAVRTLVPVPQAAIAHAETFPLESGAWWAFASNEQAVPQGAWTYPVELDITIPKKTKSGAFGLSAGIFKETLDELVAPAKFEITFKGKKATLSRVDGGATSTEEPSAPVAPDEPPVKGGNKASGG